MSPVINKLSDSELFVESKDLILAWLIETTEKWYKHEISIQKASKLLNGYLEDAKKLKPVNVDQKLDKNGLIAQINSIYKGLNHFPVVMLCCYGDIENKELSNKVAPVIEQYYPVRA